MMVMLQYCPNSGRHHHSLIMRNIVLYFPGKHISIRHQIICATPWLRMCNVFTLLAISCDMHGVVAYACMFYLVIYMNTECVKHMVRLSLSSILRHHDNIILLPNWPSVCMYVCMCVCVRVCTYVCVV